MDMEQLSKSQIVLLTLLVSFVTSIATGIVTVSLMDQAPPAIAQTVNRIIERTVEKVVPSGQAAASVVTQEKTVIVRESDLISQALERFNPSVVRIYTTSVESPVFLGLGVVVNASGTIATDVEALGGATEAVAELKNQARVRIFLDSNDELSGIVYLVSATSTIDGKSVGWTPATISGLRTVLGETVVMLAGKTVSRIAAGIITSLISLDAEKAPQVLDTDINHASILSGSPLINTDGSLLGISTGVARAASPSGFISASALMKPKPEDGETQ